MKKITIFGKTVIVSDEKAVELLRHYEANLEALDASPRSQRSKEGSAAKWAMVQTLRSGK